MNIVRAHWRLTKWHALRSHSTKTHGSSKCHFDVFNCNIQFFNLLCNGCRFFFLVDVIFFPYIPVAVYCTSRPIRSCRAIFCRLHFKIKCHKHYIRVCVLLQHIFLAATKQLYECFSPSVRPSVCLSVTPFWLCSHHRIIMKFIGVITNDKSDVHAKGEGQRSKVKVTEVNTQLSRFRTVIPVSIHIWWWNDAQSLMMLRRGALLFFKVIRQISRSHS